jgi:hypothetical protein
MKKTAVAFVNSVFKHVETEGIKDVKAVKKFGSVYKCEYHVDCKHLYKIELDPQTRKFIVYETFEHASSVKSPDELLKKGRPLPLPVRNKVSSIL